MKSSKSQSTRPDPVPPDADVGAPPLDAAPFKAVMRKLAGTVMVISAGDESGLGGMTATAMCSVSADPPTILIVVNRSARTHSLIARSKAFAVNILAEGQGAVAQLFAGKADDPFAQIDHKLVAAHVPVIDGGAAYVQCAVVDRLEVETHTIFVGRVIRADATAAQPLVYHDARYVRVAGE